MAKTKLNNSPLTKTVKLANKAGLKKIAPLNPSNPPTARFKRTSQPVFE